MLGTMLNDFRKRIFLVLYPEIPSTKTLSGVQYKSRSYFIPGLAVLRKVF